MSSQHSLEDALVAALAEPIDLPLRPGCAGSKFYASRITVVCENSDVWNSELTFIIESHGQRQQWSKPITLPSTWDGSQSSVDSIMRMIVADILQWWEKPDGDIPLNGTPSRIR